MRHQARVRILLALLASMCGASRAVEHPGIVSKDAECSSCHAMKDIHAGQFRNGREEDCTNCHAPTEWKQTIFNHDRAKFPLDVAHRKVACEKCHKEQKTAAGTTVRVYRGTPTECVNCH